MDMYFALSWALVTGFQSPLPWFYPLFFAIMIGHRARRDIQKCEAKYGEAWQEYKRQVPYLFIPYATYPSKMLIEESYRDVPTKADGNGTMRAAGVTPVFCRFPEERSVDAIKVTGPVARLARQIAGHGFIVAAPSSYHEFIGPEPLPYDGPGTDEGNKYKFRKDPNKVTFATQKVAAYDEDAALSVSTLLDLPTCNGKVGATGMCLGMMTAIHLRSRDKVIHGKMDGHVPPEGRDLIRKTLHDKGVCFSFHEIAWAQRECLIEVRNVSN
ncbi:MAG: hypothetical protein Q9219_005499 [cf. Caloplaca sp. 3 TL-2023]